MRIPVRVLLSVFLFGASWTIGCNAADPVTGQVSEQSLAAAPAAAGAHCDEATPCGAGLYCATDATSQACGAGVCKTDPQTCPLFWILGSCGCDGNWYLNDMCAHVHGAATIGPRAVGDATVAEIVGTWSRVVSQDTTAHVEHDETLVVDSDGTYELSHTERCLRSPGRLCWYGVRVEGETAGTISAANNGGFQLDGSCVAGDCSTIASELTLVHNCHDYTGALQLAITPPGDNPQRVAYYLNRQ